MICLIFLGGGWPDDVRFPRRSEDCPPLVVVWAEDVSIMRQAKMLQSSAAGLFISRGRHPGAPVDLFLTQRHHGAARCYFSSSATVVPRR